MLGFLKYVLSREIPLNSLTSFKGKNKETPRGTGKPKEDLTMMNRKVKTFSRLAEKACVAIDYAMAATPGIILAVSMALADGEKDGGGGGGGGLSSATGIFSYIIKILGAFALIRGGIAGYSGLTNYGEAKSEGEGPAMAKAKGEITAAIILMVVGGAAATFATSFASAITAAINFSG